MAATNASKVASAKNDVVGDTKEIVEDLKELVEDSVDLVKLSWLTRNPKVVVAVGTATGVLLGFGAAYLALGSHFRKKYQQMADEQIQDVRENYRVLNKDGIKLEDLAAQYPDEEREVDKEIAADIIRENGYVSYESVPPVIEDPAVVQSAVEEQMTVTQAIVEATQPVERNLFESDMPDTYFLFEEEMNRREERPLEPYVITQEEFNENETNFSQAQLTYYAGDDVVTDENDKTVDEPDPVIGPENTLRFGHGSGDPNVVYIRNERLKIDIELNHSPGKYVEEVLGLQNVPDGDSLKHSAPRKFRPERD